MTTRAGGRDQSDLTEGVAERPQAGEFVVGAVLLGAAAFALSRVAHITSPVGYSPAGPRFIPLVVCLIWLALSLAYLAQSLRHRLARTTPPTPAPPAAVPPATSGEPDQPADTASAFPRGDAPAGDPPVPDVATAGAGGLRTLTTPALLVAVLIAYQWLLEPLGYILATALAFMAASRILGSRQIVRDVIIGVLLAIGIYFAFVDGLAIRLPQGVIPL